MKLALLSRYMIVLATAIVATFFSLASYAVQKDGNFSEDELVLRAEQGDAEAMYNLGVMYGRGLYVKQNLAESFVWHRRAAEQGFVLAMRAVAIRYDRGEGIEKDYVEASKWYQRAALKGDWASMNNLASLYSRGQGLERNLPMAFAWLTLAVEVATRSPSAQPYLETYALNLKRTETLLSEPERLEASRLLEQLRPQISR